MIMRRTALLTVPNGSFRRSRNSLAKLRHTCRRGRGRFATTTIRHRRPPGGHEQAYLAEDQRNHHGHKELREDGGEGDRGGGSQLEERSSRSGQEAFNTQPKQVRNEPVGCLFSLN